ncbi:unnamed protein product, partial [Discosporangium mesarthrocarpum]
TAAGAGARAGAVVVVVDGTWPQAKGILKANPFLVPNPPGGGDRSGNAPTTWPPLPQSSPHSATGLGSKAEAVQEHLCRAVCFKGAGPSGYVFRQGPREECLSTLESVAYTLEVLEPTREGLAAVHHLRQAFSTMVSKQTKMAALHSNPRHINRRGRTANRVAQPHKDVTQTGGAAIGAGGGGGFKPGRTEA